MPPALAGTALLRISGNSASISHWYHVHDRPRRDSSRPMPSPWTGGRYGVGFQVFQVRSFKIRGQELGGKKVQNTSQHFTKKKCGGREGKGGGGEGKKAVMGHRKII